MQYYRHAIKLKTCVMVHYGLFIFASSGSDIINNHAINNEYGILLNQSMGNNLSSNEMVGNKYNFGCQRDNYMDNSNLADGKPVYYLANSKDLEIDTAQDAATICCIDCYNITIGGLNLKNSTYGVYFDNTSHSFIEGNILSNNGVGISLVNSYNNSIKGNQVADNIEGISLTSSRYNVIRDNKALDSQTGFLMVASDYNKAIGNFISHNENGLKLFKSGINFLESNNLTCNSIGIEFSHSWFNSLFNNNISSNVYGILLYLSTNNNLSGNQVNNNSKGIISDPLDDNIFSPDNKFIGNGVELENYIWRSTDAPGNSPSIAVRINSNPKDATIIFRNKPVETPGPIYFTEPGEYNILIKKEGYKDGNISIKIPEEISLETFPPSMSEQSINLTPDWDA
jgi:parallel beta-helix repeat protein